MDRRFVLIVFIVGVVAILGTTRTTQAFSLGGILGNIRQISNSTKAPSVTFPFGGKIVESNTACKLHYWMTEPPFFIPHPGIPIPLFGTKIKVGPPGIPASNVFTFPGITKIYANKNEDKEGVMTLGIASNAKFVSSLIDKVNSALGKIPPIIVGSVAFFQFSLSCPDGGIILKIGTSGKR